MPIIEISRNTPPTAAMRKITAQLGGSTANPTYPLTPKLLATGLPVNFAADHQGRYLYFYDATNGIRSFDMNNPGNAPVSVLTQATIGAALTYLAVALDNSALFATSGATNLVYKIDLTAKTISVLAGSGAAANTDGTGAAAAFNAPCSIAVDVVTGTRLYVFATGALRQIVIATGVVTTLATSQGTVNNAMTVDAQGYGYIGDSQRIVKVTPGGAPQYLVSTPGLYLTYVAVDDDSPAASNIYFATNGGALKRYNIAANTSVSLTTATIPGLTIGCMYFRHPFVVWVDSSGNLYTCQG